ncbi:NAD(+) diphosphatase [Roseovarius amoyensis]|uniref:NAD(+) diphosphatase n=1 Tax=Roseovarius amoyensis TaxID=2211448 RepID=UPI000DBE62B0|nr:NAD(+) diphosphatase [Roseovarius amoyensis]
MKEAETVTFGGSGLDRAAPLRADPAALEQAVARGQAETLLLWRGKPLVAAPGHDRLVRLPPDHPVFEGARMPPILLGREPDGRLVLARDISAWRPDAPPDSAGTGFDDMSQQRHPALPDTHVFADLRRIMTRLSPRDAEYTATAKALIGWHESHRFCSRCGAESRMIMAGWQRSCDACGGQHFPRSDPVVIMLVTKGNQALVGRSPGWPEGHYSCLAGFVEPGETIEAAVRREVFEETGIHTGGVEYLASQPWAFPSSLMLGCRAEALDTGIHIDPVEIEDARWVSREEVMAAFSGQHPQIRPAREGAIAHFLLRRWLADTLA